MKSEKLITYLTGSTTRVLERALAGEHGFGLMIQPGNAYHKRLGQYEVWGGDNGAFTKRGAFDPKRFRKMLARPELREHAARCLFVAAPDVLRVMPNGMVHGEAVATLKQFPEWAHEIRAAGLPVAFIAQNGLERILGDVPWELVDALFIGGSTEWKLGQGARKCVEAAQARGIHTHMGRVNSYKRLATAQRWGVDSADGTFLSFAHAENLGRLRAWMHKAAQTTKQLRIPE
jgi:hypothetical protein